MDKQKKKGVMSEAQNKRKCRDRKTGYTRGEISKN